MADWNATPHGAALALLDFIMQIEYPRDDNKPDREWVLRTYAQCYLTVNRPTEADKYAKQYTP